MIVGILECWSNRPEWMHHGDFADWFPPFLHKADPSLTFKVYHAHLGDLPSSAEDCDAWLITGSAASVYEDLPWQADLADFLHSARSNRPIIGVCYGHQLLHHMYGGVIEKAANWGIGVHSYDVDQSFGGAETLRLLASHQDQVTRVAVGSQVLASSDFCPIAATRFDSDMITIQPHPELTVALGRDVFESRRDVQGDEAADVALASLDASLDDAVVAHWMVAFMRDFAVRNTRVA